MSDSHREGQEHHASCRHSDMCLVWICDQCGERVSDTLDWDDIESCLHEAQWDHIAFRGVLGEPIPEGHDGKLSDGTVPKNLLAEFIARERDAALREAEELREALREEPGKWGWDVVLLVGRRVLEEVYPADIFTGASGDLGPTYIVALRNALAALAEKGKP